MGLQTKQKIKRNSSINNLEIQKVVGDFLVSQFVCQLDTRVIMEEYTSIEKMLLPD